MGKKLSEMTREELWKLFPIFLTPPDSRWTAFYDAMSALLARQPAASAIMATDSANPGFPEVLRAV